MVRCLFLLLGLCFFPALPSDNPQKLLCPVCEKTATMDYSESHRGGKIYFCTGDCVKQFQATPLRYAVLANMQLVSSGQAKQIACPVTGEDIQPNNDLVIDGLTIRFCCIGCRGKVADEEQKEIRRYYVFGNNAFRRGFQVRPKGTNTSKENR